MIVFPPCAAVTVVLDGIALPAYVGACEARGHVYAPVRPFLTGIADRVYYDGDDLVIERGRRSLRYAVGARQPDALDSQRVPLAPIARAFGGALSYDAADRILTISMPGQRTAATPPPFDPGQPQASPSVVFTPAPIATARPVWNGPPRPRRTPIPASDPP